MTDLDDYWNKLQDLFYEKYHEHSLGRFQYNETDRTNYIDNRLNTLKSQLDSKLVDGELYREQTRLISKAFESLSKSEQDELNKKIKGTLDEVKLERELSQHKKLVDAIQERISYYSDKSGRYADVIIILQNLLKESEK